MATLFDVTSASAGFFIGAGMQLATATDWAIIQSLTIEVLP